jgi:hypothetical protein
MALAHIDVARRLMANKPAAGSRMFGQITHRALSPTFTVVSEGVSYRTTIVKVVVNHHTQLSELWTTPIRYSSSTDRHEQYFRSAFIDKFMANHGCDHATATAQIFQTPAVEDGMTRTHPSHAQRVLRALHDTWLPQVDKPRLRSATRMGNIEGARYRMERVIDRMARGVPVDTPDAETLYECQSMLAFLENTQALYRHDTPESIDEVRTAVRAWLALNDPKNQ